MPLTATEFDFVRELVRNRAAIVLEPGKEYLIEARLTPVAREHDLSSIAALVALVRESRDARLTTRIVEAMTTNETSWFRDIHPFDAMRDEVLPALVDRRRATRELVIWSAASSSGQEPYSIAMLVDHEFPELASWNVRLLATDVSREMLDKARAGRYSSLEVNRGLPAALLVKYFTKHGVHYEIDARLRAKVDFRPANLAGAWPAMPTVDVVFLRNVLIYFDIETKRRILGRVRRVLAPDGYLFLGGAETTLNLDDGFERITSGRASCYRLRDRR